MTVYTFPESPAADGYEVSIDDGNPGNVSMTSTVPGRTPETIVKSGYSSLAAALVAARELLVQSLDAKGELAGHSPVPDSDCLALVEIERLQYDFTRPNSAFHTVNYFVGTARESAEFDAREAALS